LVKFEIESIRSGFFLFTFVYLKIEIMDGKTKAIVAHITIIGWIVAIVINSNDKDEFAGYYIRQLLGLYLTALVLSIIPVIGWALSIVIFVF